MYVMAEGMKERSTLSPAAYRNQYKKQTVFLMVLIPTLTLVSEL